MQHSTWAGAGASWEAAAEAQLREGGGPGCDCGAEAAGRADVKDTEEDQHWESWVREGTGWHPVSMGSVVLHRDIRFQVGEWVCDRAVREVPVEGPPRRGLAR